MGWRILLPQEITGEGEQSLVSTGHTLIRGRGFETEGVLADMKEHRPDVMIVRTTPITREITKTNPNLKVAVRHGAGFDTLDVKACCDNGVQTLYTPVANDTSVAETTMLLVLECSRNVTELRRIWVQGYYKTKLRTRKTTVNGKTVGIIGCGSIGNRLAVRALDVEMNVLAYDPYRRTDKFPEGVEVIRGLDRIFKENDYVSLHVPGTPITRGVVNKEHPGMMRPTASLINTTKGGYVVGQDLYEAYKNKTITGAGLDAIQKEPMDPADPLLTLDNIIVYPHIGGGTMEATYRASYFTAMGVQEIYKGKEPTWPINDIDYATAPTYTDTKKSNKKSSGMFDF